MLIQFDPKKYNVVVGTSAVSGFADGTFIVIEANSDTWVKTTGSDGLTIRVRQNDDTANITLSLLYSSPSVKILENYRTLDLNTSGGYFNFLAVDSLNPGNSHISAKAWIRRPPTMTGSKEAPVLEYLIDTAEMQFNLTGGVIL